MNSTVNHINEHLETAKLSGSVKPGEDFSQQKVSFHQMLGQAHKGQKDQQHGSKFWEKASGSDEAHVKSTGKDTEKTAVLSSKMNGSLASSTKVLIDFQEGPTHSDHLNAQSTGKGVLTPEEKAYLKEHEGKTANNQDWQGLSSPKNKTSSQDKQQLQELDQKRYREQLLEKAKRLSMGKGWSGDMSAKEKKLYPANKQQLENPQSSMAHPSEQLYQLLQKDYLDKTGQAHLSSLHSQHAGSSENQASGSLTFHRTPHIMEWENKISGHKIQVEDYRRLVTDVESKTQNDIHQQSKSISFSSGNNTSMLGSWGQVSHNIFLPQAHVNSVNLPGAGQTFYSQLSQQLNQYDNAQIAEKTKFILKDHNQAQIQLILWPKNLGKVNIQMSLVNSELNGVIKVENQKVKQIFQDNIKAFKEQLAMAGFSQAHIVVEPMDLSDSHDNSHSFGSFEENRTNFPLKNGLAEQNIQILNKSVDPYKVDVSI